MKKILILLLISVFTIQYGNAQNYKNDGKPYDFFCQLLGYENLSGQLRLKILWNNEKEENNLRDEKGNKIEFQTMTDAMNYMSKRGWEYVECVNYEKVCPLHI